MSTYLTYNYCFAFAMTLTRCQSYIFQEPLPDDQTLKSLILVPPLFSWLAMVHKIWTTKSYENAYLET